MCIQEVMCDVASEENEVWETEENVVWETEESEARETKENEVWEKEENEYYDEDDCDEFKSKIWNKALGNQKAMNMMKMIFASAEIAGTDQVCSDMVRSFINFVTVLITDPTASYSVKMFKKLIWSIMMNIDMTSQDFTETKRVVERIIDEKEVRDLTINFIIRSVKFISIPDVRKRLFKLLEGIASMATPSANEVRVKNTLKKFKDGIKNRSGLLNGVMKRVGNFGITSKQKK